MPVVSEDVPQELKEALNLMELFVQSFKTGLAYAAPEQFDLHFIKLQRELAQVLFTLYDSVTDGPAE